MEDNTTSPEAAEEMNVILLQYKTSLCSAFATGCSNVMCMDAHGELELRKPGDPIYMTDEQISNWNALGSASGPAEVTGGGPDPGATQSLGEPAEDAMTYEQIIGEMNLDQKAQSRVNKSQSLYRRVSTRGSTTNGGSRSDFPTFSERGS